MPSLSPQDREKAISLLDRLRADILSIAGEDRELILQMKRYISKRLEFDERGNPTQRRKLKDLKVKQQQGLCALCKTSLPERGAELDRFLAIEGYTPANTQLLCHDCHRATQEARVRLAPPLNLTVAPSQTSPPDQNPSAGILRTGEKTMRVMGTFQSRDAADSVKDAFIDEGFNPGDLIVIANREKPEPPEDADLEPGTEGEGGLTEFEEKIGKVVLGIFHQHKKLEGDGTEGDPTGGALLSVLVKDQPQAVLVKAIFERHFASDIEEIEAL